MSKAQKKKLDAMKNIYGENIKDYFLNEAGHLVIEYMYEGKLITKRVGKSGHVFI